MPKLARRGRAFVPASLSLLWWASVIGALLVFFTPADASAYPWLIRHGYTNCSACHVDPSGGELLTLYGHGVSYEVLSTRYGGGAKASAERLDRRTAKAIARAASAKSAPKDDAEDQEKTETDAPAEGAEPEGATEEDDAVEEEASEEGSDEGATESAAAAEEASPFQGMSGLTGPLFGLLPPNENLLIGGAIRLATVYKFDAESDKFRFFPMQLDLYGQVRFTENLRVAASIGVGKVAAGSPHARPAQVTAGQGDQYNLLSRTHWVAFDFGGGAHTLRAGRMNLPFGIRMSEHVMWVRERTQTDRDSDQQHGVALYMGFDQVRFEVMAIAGNYQVNPDAFRERGYAGYFEYFIDPKVGVGLSSLLTVAKDDRLQPEGQSTTRQAHGPFLRAAPSETVSIMAEADVLLRSRRAVGYVGYLQADVEPFQGFHLIGTGELYDAGLPDNSGEMGLRRGAGLGRPQPGGWLSLQWFFLPHFDLRIDAIIRDDKQLFSQLHVYL